MAGWKRLAKATADGTSSTLSVSFTATDSFKLQVYGQNTSGAGNFQIRFNNDTNANRHKTRRVYDGAGTSSNRYDDYSDTKFISNSTSNALQSYMIIDVHNIDNEEHLVMGNSVESGATGAGSSGRPHTVNWMGKYTQKTPQVTSVQLITSSNNLNDKSYIVVLATSDDVISDEKTTLEDATATVSPVSITSATGWDTTNAGSNLSIDSSGKITQGNMTANGRLTYDLGSNLQGTWTIDYDFQRTSSSGGNVRPMAVATNTGSINDSGVDNNAVGQYGDTNFNAFKKEGTNADSAQGWIAGTTDMRYIRLSRTSATNFRMEVFTDSDRTTYDTSSCGSGCSGNSGIINQTISLTGGLRYLVSGNGDAGSSHTGTIENIKVYDGAIAGTTVSSPPPANTRYEEIDTRKIYRRVAGGTTSQETQNGGELFNDVEIVSQKFTSGSSKIGLIVDSVDVFIRNDTGSVSTSTNIECKIGQEWSSGVSYGTKSPSALSTSYSWQNFTPASAKRTIVENDRLMIRWADGTVTDHSIRWGSDNNAANQLPNETGEYSSDDGSNWTARSFDRCYKINYSAQWKERGTA
jgi:hypothetical protein